ncbi:propionyl-CoA carboxylase beta chain [Fonsecaea erecta]|uniref:Propionyl-CoA carboxylase beta chain n=1 Tax=Fonsecaea erecta TaxID=1367422 RepID=A0A178ZB06_9EURO|nr:propionyl-CoA carboxylase beta chain [Fonsecaea erecta]OAP56373.1 propionyl-CoA carboxylase beta chain [Fonsecaea erecta]
MTIDDTAKGKTKANARLDQIQQQVSGKPNARRPKKTKSSEGPADWSDVLAELDQVRKLAQTPKTNTTGYIRHKEAGKLWVRERVEMLLDQGSFREVGSAAGTATWVKANPSSENLVEAEKEIIADFVPSNNVQGKMANRFGNIRDRRVLLTADDFTLRAGHADGALMAKTLYMEKLAVHMRLPMIKLVDGSSGGGSITTYRTQQASYIPQLELLPWVMRQLDQGIPNCAAVVGPAVGLGAARAAGCHFSVMANDIGSLFNAGPKVVEGATFEEDLSPKELGGAEIHCCNGVIDNLAADERGCYDQIAQFLQYVPNHGGVLPPVVPATDDPNRKCPELRESIPRRRQRSYDVRSIINHLVDRESFFEIGRLWGRTVVVGLARLGGRPVGIFAEFAIGTAAERSACMKWAMELCKAYFSTTIPIYTIITRRCYGIGGAILVDNRNPNCRVAWPSVNWGSLPLDGGIEVNHRAELRRAGDNYKQVYNRLEAEYLNLMNPVRTANYFGIEEIIDPAMTRSLVCEWTKDM